MARFGLKDGFWARRMPPALLAMFTLGYLAIGTTSGRADDPKPDQKKDFTYFEKLKQKREEIRQKAAELQKNLDAAAKENIESAAKTGAPGAQTTKKVSLDQINARIAQKREEAETTGPTFEPGMKVDIIMRSSPNFYTGTLVGVNGTKLMLQTIPVPGYKPSEFELGDIGAIHTKEGIFGFSTKTKKFEPALTFFKLDKTGNFERMESSQGDTFMAETATISGPQKSAFAVLSQASDGAMCIGLPIPKSDSPREIPAYRISTVVTTEGVYNYDDATKGYTFISHKKIAENVQQSKDAAGQAYYQQQWDRHVEQYKLDTERIRAAQSYFGGYLTGGAGWHWW